MGFVVAMVDTRCGASVTGVKAYCSCCLLQIRAQMIVVKAQARVKIVRNVDDEEEQEDR